MNNFIKLTELSSDKTLVLNSNFIQSIREEKKGSYIRMAFKETYGHYEVKETIEEIMKKIDKSTWLTTTNPIWNDKNRP
jgi:uncharacterized protein YlzI (FlbEa/FlbD family)